jgi:hypothetical protein
VIAGNDYEWRAYAVEKSAGGAELTCARTLRQIARDRHNRRFHPLYIRQHGVGPVGRLRTAEMYIRKMKYRRHVIEQGSGISCWQSMK